MAHRDLASTIHFRNGAESGHTRTGANDPKPTLWLRQGHSENIQIVTHHDAPAVALSNLIEQHVL